MNRGHTLSVMLIALAPAFAHPLPQSGTIYVGKGLAPPFDNPVDAIATITDASAAKPYLLKIDPGVYDLGARVLTGKPYVDIEGSGEGVTIIQNSVNDRVFVLAANEEAREVTFSRTPGAPGGVSLVKAIGAGTLRNVSIRDSRAMLEVYASAVFDHVTIASSAPGATGVHVQDGSPVLSHCTILLSGASSTGVYVSFARPGTLSMVDSKVSADYYAVYYSGGKGAIRISSSTLKTGTGAWPIGAPQPQGNGHLWFVFNSTLENGVSIVGGNADVTCVQTFRENLAPAACRYTP